MSNTSSQNPKFKLDHEEILDLNRNIFLTAIAWGILALYSLYVARDGINLESAMGTYFWSALVFLFVVFFVFYLALLACLVLLPFKEYVSYQETGKGEITAFDDSLSEKDKEPSYDNPVFEELMFLAKKITQERVITAAYPLISLWEKVWIFAAIVFIIGNHISIAAIFLVSQLSVNFCFQYLEAQVSETAKQEGN